MKNFGSSLHADRLFLCRIARPTGVKCNQIQHISNQMNLTVSSVSSTPSTDNQAVAPSSFAELLAKKGGAVVATKGVIVKGTYDRSGLICYGGKSDGMLTAHDRENCELTPGEEAEFFVVVGEDEDEQGCMAQLSYLKARIVRKNERTWQTAAELVESKGTVTVTVKATAKRKSDGNIVGLRAVFDGIEGFIPKSLMGRVGDIENLVGQPLEVKVTKVDIKEKDLVFSRRAVLDEQSDSDKENARAFVAGLQIGQVLNGTVCNTKDFGTFVNIGPVEGLVHVSELPGGSWRSLPRGREVEVEVVGVNVKDGKVSLSILRPGKRAFMARYADKVGEVFAGRVETVIAYAAFVELEDGFSGFLHFCEVDDNFDAARKRLKVGSTVEVRIKDVDVDKGRMGLGFVRELPAVS